FFDGLHGTHRSGVIGCEDRVGTRFLSKKFLRGCFPFFNRSKRQRHDEALVYLPVAIAMRLKITFEALLADLEVRRSLQMGDALASLIDEVCSSFLRSAEIVDDDLARFWHVVYAIKEYHRDTLSQNVVDVIEVAGFARYGDQHAVHAAVEECFDIGLFPFQGFIR